MKRAFLAVAVADVVLAATARHHARRVTKPLLMPTLIPRHDRPTQQALALSGAGDVALLAEGDAAFTAGLSSFLVAHLAWMRALRARPSRGRLRRHPVAVVPYVVAWGGLNAFLWSRTGRHRWPVVGYSSVLTAMALTALDRDAAAAAGGVLFLASDGLLALDTFAGVELPAHEGWVMATYLAAQALLATGGETT